MLQHYLRIAWRNLTKNKVFSLINVTGLTVGLTGCLFMVLYVQHELSYDSFQPKGDRIARVIMEYSMGGRIQKENFTSTKVAPTFARTFPEVEQAVRMTQSKAVVKHGENLFTEKNFLFADSSFFQVFAYQLVQGNTETALNGPNKVILTEATARKYFGTANPMGKMLQIGSNPVDYTVTGVMKEYPAASQMHPDFLASFSSLGANQEKTYWNANYTTFLLLKDKSSFATLQAKIPGFMKREMQGELTGSDYATFWLEPFQRIHLYSEYTGFEPNGSITYVYIVSAVALLMLLIASFTYVNLSTARSMERAKEVGVRKVTGALKNQIFWQFISESVILTLMALLISLGAVMLLWKSFASLAGIEMSESSLLSPAVFVFIGVVLLAISFLAGSYPAIILSRYQPVQVLKGAFKNTASGLTVRRSLLIFQFIISAFLIIATAIIQNQLHYIQTKNLGYDREHIVVLPANGKVQEKIATLKTVFKANPNVLSVAQAADNPTNIKGGYSMRRADMAEGTQIAVTANPVDEAFIKTIGTRILAGTDFTPQDVANMQTEEQDKKTYSYILNESAAKELGWTPQEAVGKKMFLGDQRPGYVKAIVQDFHFSSFHNPIKPLVLFTDVYGGNLLVKVSGRDLLNTIQFLKKEWATVVPFRPFEYSFLDEEYNNLYSKELRLGKVLSVFTAIAIFLACLGLFGVSAYAIQQRTKEIGIRKVLGASVGSVVALLSKDFVKLVVFAMLIAFPLGAWVMYRWLQDFAYRVSVSWWLFAIAGGAAMFIALATISIQAIKAAVTNPVKSLRTE